MWITKSQSHLLNSEYATAVNNLEGNVLVLGHGGKLPKFNDRTTVTAVDFRATSKIKTRQERISDCQLKDVNWVLADSNQLPFPDHSFDAVTFSFFLCCVDSVDGCLDEIFRVLAHNGRLVFIEHVRSENPLIGLVQDVSSPLYALLCQNCHLNRRLIKFLKKKPLAISNYELTKDLTPWLFVDAKTTCLET